MAVVLFINSFTYELISNRTVVRNDTIFSSRGIELVSGHYTLNTDTAYMLQNDSIIYIVNTFNLCSGDSLRTEGGSGIYSAAEDKFVFLSNRTEINDIIITSDSAVIRPADSIQTFSGNVRILKTDCRIECNDIVFDRKNSTEYTEGGFSYFGNNDLYIESDHYLKLNTDSIMYFWPNGIIENSDISIQCDSFYLDDKIELLFSPLNCIILSDDYTIDGDTLYVHFKNDTVDNARIKNNISFSEDNKDRSNSFQCDSLHMKFSSGEMRSMEFYSIFNAVLTLKDETDDTESRESD